MRIRQQTQSSVMLVRESQQREGSGIGRLVSDYHIKHRGGPAEGRTDGRMNA